MSIKVVVRNSTNLEELKLEKNFEVELPEGSDMGDLLNELGLERLKEGDGSLSSFLMIFKNKKSVRSVNEDLEDGDEIKLMPLASGG